MKQLRAERWRSRKAHRESENEREEEISFLQKYVSTSRSPGGWQYLASFLYASRAFHEFWFASTGAPGWLSGSSVQLQLGS